MATFHADDLHTPQEVKQQCELFRQTYTSLFDEMSAPHTARPRDKATAAAKFEATEEQLRAARSGSILDTESTQPAKPSQKKPDAQTEEEGMSRLLKAKRRAREEFKE